MSLSRHDWKLYRINLSPGAQRVEFIDSVDWNCTEADAFAYHEENYLSDEKDGTIILAVSGDGEVASRVVKHVTEVRYA